MIYINGKIIIYDHTNLLKRSTDNVDRMNNNKRFSQL